jgi:hypothetical protein
MLAFLGPLLGGLAGLLFPGAAGAAAGGAAATGLGALLSKAAIPALGAGLGTLATGGDGKDAIRNALLMGGATALFPGAAAKIQGSEFGKNVSGGLASIFGGGPEAGAATPAPSPAPAPTPRPMRAPGEEPPRSSIFDMAGPSGMEMERAASRPPASTIPSIGEGSNYEGILGAEGFDRRAYRTPFDLDLIPPLTAGNMRPFAEGGEIAGPGTGKSDSIPATIYQDGKPVQKAALSDGEFVMTADAVKGAGKGSRERGISRMYELMRRFERGEMA